jgi:hypothetical protein
MLFFAGTPEWLAAITPTVFGILGWVVASLWPGSPTGDRCRALTSGRFV